MPRTQYQIILLGAQPELEPATVNRMSHSTTASPYHANKDIKIENCLFSMRCIRSAHYCHGPHLSVCLGRVCIVIIQCTLAQIWVCGWIVECSGHSWHQSTFTYSQPSGREVGFGQYKLGVISQERLKIEVQLWLLTGSHICCVDWHNNKWPWVTLNGHFMHRTLFLLWLSFLFSCCRLFWFLPSF